jgi:hypothetical protein
MSASLRDLNRLLDALPTPDIDAADLISQGEARLRRRRRTAVLGGVAAVLVIVIALAVGAGLNGPLRRSDGPVDRPTSSPEPQQQPVREIVYSDGSPHTTIHVGDRVVEVGKGPVHVDVTDDGIVYATGHGELWFSDGGTPMRIASHACGSFSHYDQKSVLSANTGSVVAWFDCTDAARPALAALDTGSGREAFRRPVPICRPLQGLAYEWCGLEAVIGEHVYFNRHFGRDGYRHPVPPTDRLFRFDLATGHISTTTPQSYAEDLTTHSRGLVIGETAQTGTPTDGIGQSFRVVGSRLVPQLRLPNGNEVGSMSFDTATGRPLRLHLPQEHKMSSLVLFEWLDDDTVALADGGGLHSFDIVTCRLSDGRCDLVVKAAHGVRVVPHLPLPG